MVKCCVPKCGRTNGGFHSFPTERITFQRWIRATKAFEVNNKKNPSYSYNKVCKRHFQDADYSSDTRKYLKKGTIPSVDLPKINTLADEHSYCYNGHMAMSTICVPQKHTLVDEHNYCYDGYTAMSTMCIPQKRKVNVSKFNLFP